MFKNIKDFLKAQPIINPLDKPRVALASGNLILMCNNVTDLFVYSELIRAIGGTPEFKLLEWNEVSFTVVNSDASYVNNILRRCESAEPTPDEEPEPDEPEEGQQQNIKQKIDSIINKHKNKSKEQKWKH